MAPGVRQHYRVKGRVKRLHHDSGSGFNEGQEVKDGVDDPGEVSTVVERDPHAGVPGRAEGLDHNLPRID